MANFLFGMVRAIGIGLFMFAVIGVGLRTYEKISTKKDKQSKKGNS